MVHNYTNVILKLLSISQQLNSISLTHIENSESINPERSWVYSFFYNKLSKFVANE